jgi:hypothetical protein
MKICLKSGFSVPGLNSEERRLPSRDFLLYIEEKPSKSGSKNGISRS